MSFFSLLLSVSGQPKKVDFVAHSTSIATFYLLSEFVVTTGLRLYYDTPRTYDAATLTTGATASTAMIIPPQQKSWIIKGECSKECTAVGVYFITFILANPFICSLAVADYNLISYK